MPSKREKAEIKRRFEEEWEKNRWARYALSYRKPDGTPEDRPKEVFGAWQTRDMGDHDDHAILKRLYLMPECEREAMNYLCGRADGMVFIEHAMDAQWGISRAQNGRINDDFSDGDVDFEDE